MQITRLRLSGFKSFVEPTELRIETGLTGVVGPNGCGKSNLLEALRWVMGEASAKSLRGGEMEDVIFAGTSARPRRNMAEVVLTIDNAKRRAPAAFNESDVLEVSRRIEREAGSLYRVNGRDVRQRDVQLLFADASTGAHSAALVRQGQISQIINAKPIQRRTILEEAAGISGLHSRRHEAELRLRAAETNLQRLSDVLQELEAQLTLLKRQARQAQRYKSITVTLGKAEALAHHLRWTASAENVSASEAALATLEGDCASAAEAASQWSRAQADAAEALVPLRHAEAEKAAALQRLTHEREGLDREEAKAREDAARLQARIVQWQSDLARERRQVEDARAMVTRLAEEEDALARAAEAAGDRAAAAEAQVRECDTALSEGEALLDQVSHDAAAHSAQRRAFEQQIEAATARVAKLAAEIASSEAEVSQSQALLSALPDITAAQAESRVAEAGLDSARSAQIALETARATAQSQEDACREALAPLERHFERLRAEAQTIEKLLRASTPDLFPPLIDQVRVAPGYEAALGAALGDDLVAPLDEAAPIHWRALPEDPTAPLLPEGVMALGDVVEAPPALARRLAQIGVIQPEDGMRLQPALKAGQALVSLDGGVWRWDGFTAAADAPTAAAIRLSQRNRLRELERELIAGDAQVKAAREALSEAQASARAARDADAAARQAIRVAETDAQRARETLQRLEREAAQASSRLQALEDTLARRHAAHRDALAEQAQAEAALRDLGDGGDLLARQAEQKQTVGTLRAALSDARAALEGLRREDALRGERRLTILREREDWTNRAASAENQSEQLLERLAQDEAEAARLAEEPARIAEARARLMDAIDTAEAARRAAADALAEAENRLTEADRAAKQASHDLSALRESRARAEAMLDGARARLAEFARQAHEQLDCAPQDLLARAEHPVGAPLPAIEEIEARVDKLRRDRESLGGVNLQAEDEAQEAQARLDSMVQERSDLEGAIAKLRGGISSLNREGRERLLAAFDIVNGHFKRLFASLFGGGEAELTLVESDDPLEAGLEILARPPGKKPASISLLSGGEQALTALSLIFAVFLSNPAPICVLDEVDAPLDDANVDRFCSLLEEMAATTQTRFLIITHHALTMSRMHRLFGVTMAERGVSQLVSVDLEGAERVLAAE
ncbi:MAG: chromosome segregation protein SMC [Alphaproteobacteria bacterium]|nr:chromosome segregation protein SMC [Alphaproteobacteria bacterium]